MDVLSGKKATENSVIYQLGLTRDDYRTFIFHMGCEIAEKHFPEKNLKASKKYWDMYKSFIEDLEYYISHEKSEAYIKNRLFNTTKHHFNPDLKEFRNTMLGWLEDDDAPRYIINKFTVENLKKI